MKKCPSPWEIFYREEVLATYKPEIVRHLLISSHYRSPINYSQQSLSQSVKAVERVLSLP